ncbi:reductase [Philodulcilactobacillus myokoensis]|uniref:Reductase n=1 Tax=Philodulcilactobacillus myokoensis TaxID=2929573 RepID=A0A9W6ESL1_9LACO|nr:riboflavin biosynthesis protein RibT [Philodulcilactobacillus myokoensis]GLB46895.1 reductase [Philodulcilactobacillus myokoensis]
MLFKYQNKYKKIVMDMLSLLPTMQFINHLEDEMKWYHDGDNRSLYLWKDQSNNWGGLVAIEEFQHNVLIRRIVLNPINKNPNNINAILNEVNKMYPNKMMIGTIRTARLCNQWNRKHPKLKNGSDNNG